MATTQDPLEDSRLTRLEATVDYLVRDVGEIKAEIRVQRDEIGRVRSEIGHVRNEISGVRSEMVEQIGGVRSEMVEQIGGVRSEMVEQIGSVRSEIRQNTERTERGLESVRQESRRDFRWIIGTFIALMVPTWAFIATALFAEL